MKTELPKGILENLSPGEEVLYAIRKKFSLEAKPKWLVVTDRRILYVDEKILGRYELMAVPYEKLEQVYVKVGKMYAEFSIMKEDGEEIKLERMDKTEAREAIESIRDALNEIAVEPVSIERKKHLLSEEWTIHKPREVVSRSMRLEPRARTVEKEDPLEKLKKLKELYDMGVISQEEYEEKRKKLLDRI
ncbi:PH domain-containing protein [Palaeococcus ferrophilus]|uniref:PH domain-containing protein n=1 Tax=Palaeococcus ferrophilus TaxID=83868 RepID=UPI00064E723D|nr:PH domain-containing protein [Palaeococcus ferrophilus]